MSSAEISTRRRPDQPSARRRRRLAGGIALSVAALAAMAVVWSVARTVGRDDAPPDRLADSPGVSHVHGLGVNPADGVLFVATHYGTFRIPDRGPAQRVGTSFQDTMGFTVVGPDTFLGSGHPDVAGMQAGQPSLLGLIESTDAGETWQAVSLSGQVDFHALAYAHDHVYGWDSTSGRFMVSADKQTWDARATLDLYGFAVDPNDADRVVAAAPGGIRVSSDGGRSWAPPAGPNIVSIAWAADRTLWGVEPAGGLHRSSDGARSWERVGQLPGEPQALLAIGDTLWAAAHGENDVTGIYRSTDAGATWDLRYRDDGS